jgi:predicted lysophospholipase L1 biosynthesis ABC-type transport system permease subunit
MSATRERWNQNESVAWVGHDTPTPPRVSRTARFALAGSLGATVAGMLFTDTLCPEHRAWVMAIGSIAIVAAVAAVVALVRASWVAMPLALGSAAGGVGIGIIDITHDAQRGTVVAMCFAALALLAGALVAGDLRRLEWDDRLRRSAAEPAPAQGPTADPDPAAAPVGHARRPTLVE